MNSVCLVIPVHPPKYPHIENLFASLKDKECDFDLALCVSSYADLQLLQPILVRYSYVTKYTRVIILEQALGPYYRDSQGDGVITKKKYLALYLLGKQYRYYWVVDAEIKLLHFTGYLKASRKYCEDKVVISGHLSRSQKKHEIPILVNEACIKYIEGSRADWSQYFWFSNPPIYDSELLARYFNYLNFNNLPAALGKIHYFIFDYVAYIYYCVEHHGYVIIPATTCGCTLSRSLEMANYEQWQKVNKHWSLLWINNQIYRDYYVPHQLSKHNDHNIKLVFHIDRT